MKKIWCKIINMVTSKLCRKNMCKSKRKYSNVKRDFLRKWGVDWGEPYYLYVFLYFPSFPQGSFPHWEGRKHKYDKQIQCGTKTHFERWCLPALLTLHFLQEVISYALEASNIIIGRWLWYLCPRYTSLFWASKLCLHVVSSNSVWWPIRTTALRFWLACCLTFHPTLQISCSLVLVNSTNSPIFQLCVSRWVRLDSCSIDVQSNIKANQFYLFNTQENCASFSLPTSLVVSPICFQ